MRIDWENDKNPPTGLVIDLDTGESISGQNGYCRFVDEETGEWKRWVRSNGKMMMTQSGKPQMEIGNGRVKFFEVGTPEYIEALGKLQKGFSHARP